ncbi:MAG TPA: SCP2 sterol-binding domain-containing protein [Kofleriaceae bacterium]|nr:SCP2 sterol-binding domain-containing protein [Kofleriaceae bacterium]
MSDTSPRRPPADITPTELFETWLPGEIARLRTATSAPTPPDLRTRITVAGTEGGTWLYESKGGVLSVSRSEAAADLAVSISGDDLRAMLDPASGILPETPNGGGGVNPLIAGPLVEQAKTIRGTFTFELTGFQGRDLAVAVTFGDAADPAAVISIDAETYAAMRDGSLPPAQAYFAGKINVGGDAAFALQVGMGLMAAAVS